MTINNVTIGQKFKQGKYLVCEVVDFIEKKSMVSGEIVGYMCMATGINSLATNSFEVPFATVVRHQINL